MSSDSVNRILVFGDSNSWGWVPRADLAIAPRYEDAERWSGVLGDGLGAGFTVLTDAVSGRTTDLDDPEMPALRAARNGLAALPGALAAAAPLDLVILLLGTNDLQTRFERGAEEIAAAVGRMILRIGDTSFWSAVGPYEAPAVMVMAPPLIDRTIFGDEFAGAAGKSRGLAPALAEVAARQGASFFDAGRIIASDGVDGLHWSKQAHATLGAALVEPVLKLLTSSRPA